MNLDRVEKIADAVLYEGYILYPYRPSAIKNQQRWNFGALYPRSHSLASSGADAWTMQTECLVQCSAKAILDVKVRFLHLLSREVGVLAMPILESKEKAEPSFRQVAALEVGGQVFHTWQEAVERQASVTGINLGDLVAQPQQRTFTFPASRDTELLREAGGEVAGALVRRQQLIEGAIELSAGWVAEGLCKIAARILNLTSFDGADPVRHRQSRDEALMRSFVSTHTILSARDGGEFVSLLDPPEAVREQAALCRNTGTYPVLAGEEGERDVMLSSPIILYDYPRIAPESAGDFFDGTEIDEMLTLRVLTLTDEEKREMRAGDERARRILERTETMPAEHLLKLHGAVRGVGKTLKGAK